MVSTRRTSPRRSTRQASEKVAKEAAGGKKKAASKKKKTTASKKKTTASKKKTTASKKKTTASKKKTTASKKKTSKKVSSTKKAKDSAAAVATVAADKEAADKEAADKVAGGVAAASEESPAFQGDRGGGVEFEGLLFGVMIAENWIFDFGRPVGNFYVRALGPSTPGLGDYFHMAYNVVTPFLLLLLMDKARGSGLPNWVKYLLVIIFTLGASMHLVGDSVQAKLVQSGYDLSVKVKDNEMMTSLGNQDIVNIFELVYAYDEHIGHYMWYVPYFTAFLVYFVSATVPSSQAKAMPALAWVLLPFGGAFYWYLIVEGQVWPLFIAMYAFMLWTMASLAKTDTVLDVNGKFLFAMFTLTAVLFVAWLVYMQVPVRYVLTGDLDGVPEFWESYPWMYALLIGQE